MEFTIKVDGQKTTFEGSYLQALNETKRLTKGIGYFHEKGSHFKVWVDRFPTLDEFLKARKKLI